jgi:general stress protein 26
MSRITCKREENSNIFVRVNTRKKEPFKTKYQFRDIDGKEYNIYISSKKKAFIIKETKNGKEYKVILSDDVAKQILVEIEGVKPSMIVDN